MPLKKTKRAVVPPLAAVLPNVTLKEFRASKAGCPHRLALLSAWAKASPAPADYLVRRMRRDYGIAPAWVEAFECVREARKLNHKGAPGRPVGVVAKATPRKPRQWRESPMLTMEGALSTLSATARQLGIGITLTFNAAAVPA